MRVGIPKEIISDERRIAAVADTVARMVKGGMEVVVETGAGEGSFISDDDFVKVGAKILATAEEVFSTSDVILKVQKPFMNAGAKKHEVDMMREGAILITFLQAAANLDVVTKLVQRKITTFAMEAVPRISRAQMMDALSSMATLAGYKAVIMGADNLKKIIPMLTTAAGTIHPAKVLIIGAGVAGLQAIATAKRLGSLVTAFDTRPAVGEQIKSLGGEFVPLEVDHSSAEDAGGYAKEMSSEFYKQEQDIIRKYSKDADIIISTALVPGKPAPTLITEEMVKEMKAGYVIVDLSVEQGGNCTLTEFNKIVVKHNVTVIGTVNLPGKLPVHASQLYARNMLNILNLLAPDKKEIKLDMEDEIIKGAMITHNAEVTNKNVKEALTKANISYPSTGGESRSHW